MLLADAQKRPEEPGRAAPDGAGLPNEDAGHGPGGQEREAAPDDSRQRLQSLPPKVRELVELLLMQADMVGDRLQAVALDDPLAAAEASQEAREHLERFIGAARTVGFAGLARMCELVDANVQQFLAQSPAFTAAQLGLLGDWLGGVKRYLAAFNDGDAGQNLLAQLQRPHWPVPLSPAAGAALLEQLRGLDSSEWSKDDPARAQAATAADVSLRLPDDVNRELLDILLQELPAYTQQFSASVQRLQAEGSLQDIELAQRLAHTLKGSANTVGIRGVAVLTHHLEDILLVCAKARQVPGPALLSALVDATDCLEGMTDALLGMGEAPPAAQAVLQAILDWANRIDREGLPATDEAALPQRGQPREEGVEGGPARAKPEASASMPPPAAAVRVPAELIENLFRLSGESIILNGQAQERLRRMRVHLQAMQTQFELLRQLGAELDTLIDLRDLSGRGRGSIGQDFDALEMDQYNELHTASRRMVEAAVDAREISLDARKELDLMDEVLEYQQSLVIDTQGSVMQTKLVPVASIIPRLQRSLRQTCRLTGKQADLNLTGGQLLIDGDTLNTLVDPLMHLLRNAVDHGIEGEDERQAMGKTPGGHIAFEFEGEGNNILVRCRDDGRGLDVGAIRAAAEQRGLLQPGQEATEEELQRLVLRPNFSTRSQSTQTSGRGVGMDVVRAQVVAMGGSLALRSVPGLGLTVELRAPLPLSRSHALLAYAGQYRVVISSKGISQIFYSSVGELLDLAGEPKLLLENVVYPVVKLGSLLRVAEQRREQRPHGAILLVQNEDQVTAVLVDSITDSRDVVVKSLGFYIAKIPGVVGATILGDGAVTPVIDVPELLRAPALAAQDAGLAPPEAAPAEADVATVLVVDDSLSNRRALEQLLADAGFSVRTAHDGVEAAEMLARVKPDIVLTDLEMPRMNGIELAAHIRAQPDGKTLPIIMITSRTTQRHRKLAEEAGVDFYLTKPVREDDLLGKMNGLLAPASGQEARGQRAYPNVITNTL
jgi:chemosensory pili system protein ChpA (sensor histidine kinase/response regulator)